MRVDSIFQSSKSFEDCNFMSKSSIWKEIYNLITGWFISIDEFLHLRFIWCCDGMRSSLKIYSHCLLYVGQHWNCPEKSSLVLAGFNNIFYVVQFWYWLFHVKLFYFKWTLYSHYRIRLLFHETLKSAVNDLGAYFEEQRKQFYLVRVNRLPNMIFSIWRVRGE